MKSKKVIVAIIILFTIGISIFYFNQISKKLDASELPPDQFLERHK